MDRFIVVLAEIPESRWLRLDLAIRATIFGLLLVLEFPRCLQADNADLDPILSAKSELKAWSDRDPASVTRSGLYSLKSDSSGTDSAEAIFPRFDQTDTFNPIKTTAESGQGFNEPDISSPGPDFGDFPNSAYTLKKGRAYIEYAPFTYQGVDNQNSASNSGAFLFRYGLTDDVEFRLMGAGLVNIFDTTGTVTGVAPLIIDTKIHLWNDDIDSLIPAASFEAYLQTNWASSGFQGGVQPSLNLNLDFPFTKQTNVEMTIGMTGVLDAVNVLTGERFIPRHNVYVPTVGQANLNTYQFSFQWAIEQQITDKFQVFLHGYFNGPVLFVSGPGHVIGAGYFYQASKQLTFYNSYNAGLDASSPSFITQLGLAFAF